MVKCRFLTKFGMPKRVCKVYDQHDNVDRLSYCDTTVMIKRFMNAGKVLQFNNSQALYNDINDVMRENSDVYTPVYTPDMVVAQHRIEKIKENVAAVLSEAAGTAAKDKTAAKPIDKPSGEVGDNGVSASST